MTSQRAGLTGLLALLGLLGTLLLGGIFFPASAGAIPRECELVCEEPPEEEKVVYETLTIEVEGWGSVGGSASCSNSSAFTSNTCSVKFEQGETAVLSAAPGPGMTFLGWAGACSGTGGCSVAMTSNKSVTAKFADVTAPATPTITSPTSGQVFEWPGEEAVSVSFSDSDPSAIAFGCSVDVYAWNSCSSPWSTGNLSAGEHTVYVSAKDASNNVSTAVRSFKIVIAPPGEEGGSGGEPPKEEGGGGSGGGSGAPSGGTPSPIPTIAPPPAQINAQAVVKARASGKWTILRKLALKGLPSAAAVAATCKGKGCPFKRKQIAARNGAADLTALFAKHQLGAGVLIELKVSAPGMTGETIDIKTRAGKAPKVTTS